MDKFLIKCITVIIVVLLFGFLSFKLIPSLPLFYSNQFGYGTSIPIQLNSSVLDSLRAAPFGNSTLQAQINNSTLFNASISNDIAMLKEHSTASSTLIGILGIPTSSAPISQDLSIQPNFNAAEQMLLGQYTSGAASLLYSQFQYQLTKFLVMGAVFSLNILITPSYSSTAGASLITHSLPGPNQIDLYLIKPYQPINAYPTKLLLTGKNIVYIAQTLGTIFNCNAFHDQLYNASNQTQTQAAQKDFVSKMHNGIGGTVVSYPYVNGQFGTTTFVNLTPEYSDPAIWPMVPGWLELMEVVGSPFLTTNVLNSDMTCNRYSGYNVTSTYNMSSADMLHLLSITQEYTYLSQSLLYGVPEHQSIIGSFYRGGTLLVELQNVNLGQQQVTVTIDGKPVPAQARYSFIYTNITLPFGPNTFSFKLGNKTLSSSIYVDPPLLALSPIATTDGFSFKLLNAAGKAINVTGINVTVEVPSGNSTSLIPVTWLELTNSTIISYYLSGNFTIAPSESNFTVANYSLGLANPLRIGDPVTIHVSINTSTYPNVPIRYSLYAPASYG